MMTELSHIKQKKLEMASSAMNVNVQEYYGNKSAEEMIPFFSLQILDSFIIRPYLEKVDGLSKPGRDA
ncbi:MAG: hypothetical protein IIA40_11620 [SAR324 cluster bacterium]|nr:hypothetical protein [SAR324 cluster bacterium]